MSQVAESIMPEHAPTAAPVRLPNLEQLKQAFAEDGYLVFRGVVSPERLTHLHARLAAEFDDAVVFDCLVREPRLFTREAVQMTADRAAAGEQSTGALRRLEVLQEPLVQTRQPVTRDDISKNQVAVFGKPL